MRNKQKACIEVMSDYDNIRVGKLILKGEKSRSRKRKHKSKELEEVPQKIDTDSMKHGHWWRVANIEEISGPVAIEFGNQTYVKALGNGLFILGAPHDEGEGPSPEEIFTAVIVNKRKIAFKSGYNKYLRIEKNGIVTGRSDAIGATEQWEPIFEDAKTALQGYNDCFLSIDPLEDSVVANVKKAGPEEFLTIRSQADKQDNSLKVVPNEYPGNIEQIEINYVKKFQKFQDKRLRICKDGKKELKVAKKEGNLHEILLDRRSKMKSDRYCK